MRILVLQHIACEPPGAYEDVLRQRSVELTRVELDEGEPLPPWTAYDGIVAMGGPMSVNDEAEHPWLVEEKATIAAAVRAGVPFFGACLGVQLLAASLGAKVYPVPEPEVGVLPVQLTEEGRRDPVLAGLPAELLTLQWHSDTFDLPAGATRLAGSAAYPNQAFRYGDTAYGVQFHLEVTDSLAAEWAQVPEYRTAADRTLGPGGLDRLLGAFAVHSAALQQHGRAMFARWLDLAAAG